MSLPVIGFMGKMRAGKDTAADSLAREHMFHRMSFADSLKAMLAAGFPGIDFNGGDREAAIEWLGKSPRQLMQTLGTEWGRELAHQNLWVLLLNERWKAAKQENALGLVISDVRFPNEAEWVLQQGGLLIEIVRPGRHPISGHASETSNLDHLPKVRITNDGTVPQLRAKARQAYDHWRKGYAQ